MIRARGPCRSLGLKRTMARAVVVDPIGPNDTILMTFGGKRAIAFYQADNGRCAVNAVVYEKTDAETGLTTATRVRVSLDPLAIVHIDSSDNETMSLQCGNRSRR